MRDTSSESLCYYRFIEASLKEVKQFQGLLTLNLLTTETVGSLFRSRENLLISPACLEMDDGSFDATSP
jgi:hypothetical protein